VLQAIIDVTTPPPNGQSASREVAKSLSGRSGIPLEIQTFALTARRSPWARSPKTSSRTQQVVADRFLQLG